MRRRGELNRAAAPPPPPSAVPQTEEEKKQARKTRLSQPIKAKLGYEAASPDAPWYQAKKPQRSYSSKYEQVQNVTTYFEDTASRADDKKPFDPEHQKCRDAFWALLFIAVGFLVAMYFTWQAIKMLSDDDDSDDDGAD